MSELSINKTWGFTQNAWLLSQYHIKPNHNRIYKNHKILRQMLWDPKQKNQRKKAMDESAKIYPGAQNISPQVLM